MSMPVINELIETISMRTKENYEKIEDFSNRSSKAFEVTQLINSFMGLVIFPYEFYDSIHIEDKSDTKLRRINKDGCDAIESIINTCKKENRYRNDYGNDSIWGFIRNMRHAMAHSGNTAGADDNIMNLLFYPLNEDGGRIEDIESVYFYSRNAKDPDKRFCINLKCIGSENNELKEILYAISSIFESLNQKYGEELKKSYMNGVAYCKEFLEKQD